MLYHGSHCISLKLVLFNSIFRVISTFRFIKTQFIHFDCWIEFFCMNLLHFIPSCWCRLSKFLLIEAVLCVCTCHVFLCMLGNFSGVEVRFLGCRAHGEPFSVSSDTAEWLPKVVKVIYRPGRNVCEYWFLSFLSSVWYRQISKCCQTDGSERVTHCFTFAFSD